VGYEVRQGQQPVDPEHAEDEAGQTPLTQVPAETDVPAPDNAPKPDIVTEDDGSGVAGGSSGSSSGGSGLPGHPDAPR
jgi:hypothetical protein